MAVKDLSYLEAIKFLNNIENVKKLTLGGNGIYKKLRF